MPVKFRCPSCNRRLSVSARKIGASAQCPNCKQKVVVPQESKGRRRKSEKQEATPDSTSTPSIPKQQTATIDQPAPSESAGGTTTTEPVTEPAVESVTEPTVEQTTEPIASGFTDSLAYQQAPAVVFDDGSQLPANFAQTKSSSQPTKLSPTLSRQYLLVSRKVIYLQGVLITSVALVTFILGYLIGSVAQIDPSSVDQQITVNGQLTYFDRQGKEQPDVGAVVIALPLMKTIDRESKILLAEISPAEKTPSEDHEALQTIDALGGSYHKANVEGKFTLVLPKPGSYQILMLSFNAAQPSDFIPEAYTGRINEFYEGAYDIIKNFKYRWLEIELKDGKYISHNFGRNGK